MARARNIKPSFFTNEILGTLDPIIGMAFIGLWCLADKSGRLEDRPLRIKAELFPYREGTDVNGYLTVLERESFIERYEVAGVRYIQIVNFEKHQSPHHTEKAKGFPPKPLPVRRSGDLTVKPPLDNHSSQVPTRSDSLIPDSLIPDSLIQKGCAPPASPATPPEKRSDGDKGEKQDTALQAACKETWRSYAEAYHGRYGTAPVRNATVNGQVKSFVTRLGHEESPLVAAFYVSHPGAFYVKNCHQFGHALKDAEKLRTEWATNRTVTEQQARQSDKISTNFANAQEAIKRLHAEGYQ